MNREDIFRRIYTAEREKIDRRLGTALAGRRPAALYEPSSYLLSLPGKRLRPFLVLISARAAGGSFSKVYNAAVSVEMLHNFTLAHDDIMDKAEKRRGQPTLHKKYGLNTAILAGDSLLSVAYEYLLKDTDGNAREVIRLFTRSLVEVCEGQSLDTEFETRRTVTIEEYITMITQKTAVMLETCCAMGAQLAGAPKPLVNKLAGFGRNIGIAFQIQDDLLDITAEEAEFGKKIGGDLIEGKKTYLFLRAYEKAGVKAKALLKRMIDNKGIQAKDVPAYYEIYKQLGVLEDAKAEIEKYTRRALKNLQALPSEEDRAMFAWLADSLIKRTR